MAQNDYGTIDPATTSGTNLATLLNSQRDSYHSTHKGGTEPSFLVSGLLWLDDSGDPNWSLKLASSAGNNATICTVNKTTLAVSFPDLGKTIFTEGSGNAGTANTSSDTVVAKGDGDTGVSVVAPDANYAGIYLGGVTTPDLGRLRAHPSTNALILETNHASGNILFNSGATSFAMKITSGGTVGIGTSSPNANSKLHVYTGASTATANTNWDDVVIEGASTWGVSLLGTDAGSTSLALGSATTPDGLRLTYTESTPQGRIGTNKSGADLYLTYGANNGCMMFDASTSFCGLFQNSPEGIFHVGDSVATAMATMVSGDNYNLVVVDDTASYCYNYFQGASGAYIDLFSSGGTLNQRGFRIGTALSGGLTIQAINDAGTVTYTCIKFDPSTGEIIVPAFAGGGDQNIRVDNNGVLYAT